MLVVDFSGISSCGSEVVPDPDGQSHTLYQKLPIASEEATIKITCSIYILVADAVLATEWSLQAGIVWALVGLAIRT